MSKVDERVRKSIAAYPMLYDNRFDVLHHIFCVLGNGYEWVDGVPVSEYAEDTEPWSPEQERQDFAKRMAGISPESWQERMEDDIAEYQAAIDALDERVADGSFETSRQAVAYAEMAQIMGPQYGPIYPQSPYALLMNLPADIDPDWAEAAEQMHEITSKLGWKF